MNTVRPSSPCRTSNIPFQTLRSFRMVGGLSSLTKGIWLAGQGYAARRNSLRPGRPIDRIYFCSRYTHSFAINDVPCMSPAQEMKLPSFTWSSEPGLLSLLCPYRNFVSDANITSRGTLPVFTVMVEVSFLMD